MFGKIVGITKRVGKAYAWSITGDLKEVRENASRVKERLHGLLNRKYANETFEEALERHQVTDKHLKQRYDTLAGLSVLYGAIVLVALVSLAASYFSPRPINHALMSLGVVVVASTKFLSARFRVAQIRERKLFSFKSWSYRFLGL